MHIFLVNKNPGINTTLAFRTNSSGLPKYMDQLGSRLTAIYLQQTIM